jgi:HlyD family secretion protein
LNVTDTTTPETRESIQRHMVAGVTVVLMLVGGVGGWAATTELSGALIAPGSIVVDTNIKKVQHPTGGVVGEVRVRDLFQKNLIQINRLTQLEREATRLDGERGQLTASVAQSKGKIAELELQVLQIDQDLSSEVAKELRDVDGKIGEFVERKVTAEDQLKRIDIRAPQDGTVFQSNVHTIGGVVTPADAIMMIVPDADNLTVEAKINPQDIDQLRVGQKALLRFTTFNQRTTPEIFGEVTRISADISTDQRSGATFYTIRIGLSAKEIARLGEVRLVPGMPVETFVQTGDRTVMSYLIKPMYDQLSRAFREK